MPYSLHHISLYQAHLRIEIIHFLLQIAADTSILFPMFHHWKRHQLLCIHKEDNADSKQK